MLKVELRIALFWLVLLAVLPAHADTCAGIWPAAVTANSTKAPVLPAFSGTSALTLNRTLGAGDYQYAATSLNSGTLTTGSVSSRLYFNGGLSLSGSVQLNSTGNPQNLIIIVNGSVTISGNAIVRGLIFATGSISISQQATITGAVTAAGSVSTSGTATVSYSSSAVVAAGYGTLCTPPVRPVLRIVSPVCGTNNKIIVSFDSSGGRLPLGSSAETISNYQVVGSNGTTYTVAAATLSAEGYDVQLTVAPAMQNGTDIKVSVANVQDADGIAMSSGSDSFYYSNTTNGLVGNYWSNTSFSGSSSLERVDSNINFDWGPCIFFICTGWPVGGFSTGFSTRWEGYVQPDVTGTYYFQTSSDEGARLWLDNINGSTIIDQWSGAGTATSTGINLTAGVRYPVKLEYYKTGAWFTSNAQMYLLWKGPSAGSFSVVPNGNLYTCVDSFVSNTGLVAYYQLERPTWNGTTNEVLDSSGNNLDGTTVGNPVATTGKVCNGASMNGSNYIRINDNPLLDLTNSLSITAWIKLNALGVDLKSIFSKDTNYEFHINQNGEVYWWWNTNAGLVRSFTSSPYTISLNTWHHIGVVYSPTRQSIYIDGVEVAYRTYTGEILATNNLPLEIGADQGIASRVWDGMIDEVRLYDRALSANEVVADMNATHPCASYLNHFEITVAANASVCAATPVTIRAVKSDGTTYTGYTGTINIATSAGHGDWSISSGNGTLNPNPDTNDDGAVQYTFSAADNGQIVLNLADTHADQTTIGAVENGGSATGTSSAVTFSQNALQINFTDSLGSDVIAGRDHALQVQALRQDPTTGVCGTFTAYNGNIGLKGWITRDAADPGGAAPAISTAAADVALPSGAAPANNNVTLAFTRGVANLLWKTTDVGRYTFNLADDSSGLVKDANGQPIAIQGSSAAFTVRPFGLDLQAQSQRAPATANPGASTASGPAFIKAGENFTVQARGVVYQAVDDADGNGIPDNGANLSDNPVTSHFGAEGATVTLSATQVLPNGTGAVFPGLSGTTNIAAFTNGVGNTSVSYDEVGIIGINGSVSNYLKTTRSIQGTISHVGRFVPDYFTVGDNSPQLRNGAGSWSCNFTYQGQPFGFTSEPQLTITAHNVHGGITRNYTGDFWKLAIPQHNIELEPASLPSGSSCVSGGTLVAGCFSENSASVSRTLSDTSVYDGQGIFSTGTHTLTVNKLDKQPNAGDVPYDPKVDYVLPLAQLTDSDGVCYESSGACSEYRISGIGGTQLRYGRGWLDNTTGPVMSPLVMTLRLQYWNAAGSFVSNTDDNSASGCSGTQVNTTDIQLSNFTGNLSSGETVVSGLEQHPGYYLLSLSAPGYDSNHQSNSGTALVTWLLDNDPSNNNPGETCSQHWLCYDFNGDGTNDNPTAKAIFGALPDGRPLLFLKESYR